MNILNILKKIFGIKTIGISQQQVTPPLEKPDHKESSKEKFERAMKFVRVVEGGKFNHPNDPGGFTNMGLTQRDYPKLDLKNLTREQADNIFYKDYWAKSAANKLPFPVYIPYFDSVVNTGVGRANRILQKSVKVKQDGIVGPVTLKAVKNHTDHQVLSLLVADNKQAFYESLVKRNKKFKSFIRGWTRRTNALKQYIETGNFTW
jgi:lysozyme family protein